MEDRLRSTKSMEDERWQAERNTVLERNKFMWNNSLFSDIKFIFESPNTEPICIPAHKYVLAICSPVFFAMFYGRLAEKKGVVEIKDYHPDDFLCFLRYIYCEEANFYRSLPEERPTVDITSAFDEPANLARAIELWYLADKYDIPELAMECVTFLDGNMDPLSAFHVVRCAGQLNDEAMATCCWEVIDYNAKAIIADDSFLDLEHDLLGSFLERSSLYISDELSLFKVVNHWAAKRCKEKGQVANGANKRAELQSGDLLKKIRFTLMSPAEFTDEVLPEQMLTNDEVIEVFKVFSGVTVPYPEIPRKIERPVRSCRMAHGPLLRQNDEVIKKSAVLVFMVNKPIFLLGLQFLFHPKATHGWVTLSLWQQGAKIKELTARSFGKSWNPHSVPGENKVFFNRPICIDAHTCYVIELLAASSCSPSFYVTSRSNVECESAYRNTNETLFRFSGELFEDDIPDNCGYYFGQISDILFRYQPCCVQNSVPVVRDDHELYESYDYGPP